MTALEKFMLAAATQAVMKAAAVELVKACVLEFGLDADDRDDEPVAHAWDGEPSPLTFGHIRRLKEALDTIDAQAA